MEQLTITQEGTTATVIPAGDIVIATAMPLRTAMRDLIRQGSRQLVLDLSNTCMIDSAGLGLIMAAHNSLKSVQGELRVIQASTDLLGLFQAMRLHQHLNISGTK